MNTCINLGWYTIEVFWYMYFSSICASLVAQTVKNLPAVQAGSIPTSGRSPEEGNGYPLQYSCLENSMNREAWQALYPWGHRVRHDGSNLARTHTHTLFNCIEVQILPFLCCAVFFSYASHAYYTFCSHQFNLRPYFYEWVQIFVQVIFKTILNHCIV